MQKGKASMIKGRNIIGKPMITITISHWMPPER
jgi:hypothetical protein